MTLEIDSMWNGKSICNGIDPCSTCSTWLELNKELQTLKVSLKVESASRSMFVARLENMQLEGDQWLTISSVLSLLNNSDMLAQSVSN